MNKKIIYIFTLITLMMSLSACGTVNSEVVADRQAADINNSLDTSVNEDNMTNADADEISEKSNASVSKVDNYNVEKGTEE